MTEVVWDAGTGWELPVLVAILDEDPRKLNEVGILSSVEENGAVLMAGISSSTWVGRRKLSFEGTHTIAARLACKCLYLVMIKGRGSRLRADMSDHGLRK